MATPSNSVKPAAAVLDFRAMALNAKEARVMAGIQAKQLAQQQMQMAQHQMQMSTLLARVKALQDEVQRLQAHNYLLRENVQRSVQARLVALEDLMRVNGGRHPSPAAANNVMGSFEGITADAALLQAQHALNALKALNVPPRDASPASGQQEHVNTPSSVTEAATSPSFKDALDPRQDAVDVSTKRRRQEEEH